MVPRQLILTHPQWSTPYRIRLPEKGREKDLGDHLQEIDRNKDGKIVYAGSFKESLGEADFFSMESLRRVDWRAHELSNILRGRGFMNRHRQAVREKAKDLPTVDRIHMLDLVADAKGLAKMAMWQMEKGNIDEAVMLADRAKVHLDEWHSATSTYLNNREEVNAVWHKVRRALAIQQIEERRSMEPRFGITPEHPPMLEVGEAVWGEGIAIPLDVPTELTGEVSIQDLRREMNRVFGWLRDVKLSLRPKRPWPEVSNQEFVLEKGGLIPEFQFGGVFREESKDHSHLLRTTYSEHSIDFDGQQIKIPGKRMIFLRLVVKPKDKEGFIKWVEGQPNRVEALDLVVRNQGKQKIHYGVLHLESLVNQPVTITRVTDEHFSERTRGKTPEDVIRWEQNPSNPYDHLFTSKPSQKKPQRWLAFSPKVVESQGMRVEDYIQNVRRFDAMRTEERARVWRRQAFYNYEMARRIYEVSLPLDTTLVLSTGDRSDYINYRHDLSRRVMSQTEFLHQFNMDRYSSFVTLTAAGNHLHHPDSYSHVFRNLGIPKEVREKTCPFYGTLNLPLEGVRNLYPHFDKGSFWKNAYHTLEHVFTLDRWAIPDDDTLAERYRYQARHRQLFRKHGPLTIVNLDTGPEDFHAKYFFENALSKTAIINGFIAYFGSFKARGKGLRPDEFAFVARQMIDRAMHAETEGRLERFFVQMHYPLVHHTKGIFNSDDWVQDTIADEPRRVLMSLFWVLREHIQVIVVGHTHHQEEYGIKLKATRDPDSVEGMEHNDDLQMQFENELRMAFRGVHLQQGEELEERIRDIWVRYGIIFNEPLDGNQGMPGDACPGTITEQLKTRSIEEMKQDYGVIQITGGGVQGRTAKVDAFRFDDNGRWVGYELRGLTFHNDGSTLHTQGFDVCKESPTASSLHIDKTDTPDRRTE